MNFVRIQSFLDRLSFRQAVWLFPLAFVLHVMEEAPHFTDWANQYASSSYTSADFIRNNTAGTIIAVLSCAIVWLNPHRHIVFFFFAAVLTQSALCNALFHIGATAVFGVYSPGVITSLTLYPAIFYYLSCLAYRERLLKDKDGILSLVIAAAIHIVVVATQVFFVKLV